MIDAIWGWIAAAGIASIGGIWAYINRTGSQRHQDRVMAPPSWSDVWQEMKDQRARATEQDARIKALEDEQKDRARWAAAVARILSSLASQWGLDRPPPVLDSTDLSVVGEDTIPPQWYVNHNKHNRRRNT